MTSPAVATRNVQFVTPDLVIDLSQFATTIDVARLDPAVIKAVKSNILDTLSCALAGSSANAIADVAGLVRD
jgi:2-methylcitrate dehydratase PrpD